MKKGFLLSLLVLLLSNRVGALSLLDSVKLENEKLKTHILELELRKKIQDSVTLNGSPVLIEKINGIEKQAENYKWLISLIIPLLFVWIGVLGWGIWQQSDKVARITAKDEFNKGFKEYQEEIKNLAADAKGMHNEIAGYHKGILEKKKDLDLEEIQNRNKDGKAD